MTIRIGTAGWSFPRDPRLPASVSGPRALCRAVRLRRDQLVLFLPAASAEDLRTLGG
ncbi:hypothetical protein ACRAWD_10245 [Caulobacter segnis]